MIRIQIMFIVGMIYFAQIHNISFFVTGALLNTHIYHIQGYPYSTDPSGNAITFDRDVASLNDIPRLKRQSKQIFTMNQYTPREIVEIYIQQKKSIVKTQRAFKTLKNVRGAPSKNTIKRLY